MIKEELAAVMDEGILDPARGAVHYAVTADPDATRTREVGQAIKHKNPYYMGALRDKFGPFDDARTPMDLPMGEDFDPEKVAGASDAGALDYTLKLNSPEAVMTHGGSKDAAQSAADRNRQIQGQLREEGQDDRASRVAGAIADLLDALK